MRRLFFELRRYDGAQRLGIDRPLRYQIIQGDEAHGAATVGDGNAADAMLLHQLHDIGKIGCDVTGDDILRHELGQGGACRIETVAEYGERKIAIGDNPGEPARVAHQDRADMIVGHGSCGLLDFRLPGQDYHPRPAEGLKRHVHLLTTISASPS